MTSVDGYTKAGADATFATIGHTHAPSGGGATYEGFHSFVASELDYLNSTGEGTQLKPLNWVSQGSIGPDGMFVDGIDLDFVYVDAVDKRLYFKKPGVYLIRYDFHIQFPNSTPTIVGPTLRSMNMDPDITTYLPVGPPRPETYTYEGNHRNVPHANGTILSNPVTAVLDDWAADVYLWWNTNDILVDGGMTDPLTPGDTFPTIRVSFAKIG